jgi:hypothetical protein
MKTVDALMALRGVERRAGAYQPLRDAIALVRDLRNRLDETLVLSVWGAQGADRRCMSRKAANLSS